MIVKNFIAKHTPSSLQKPVKILIKYLKQLFIAQKIYFGSKFGDFNGFSHVDSINFNDVELKQITFSIQLDFFDESARWTKQNEMETFTKNFNSKIYWKLNISTVRLNNDTQGRNMGNAIRLQIAFQSNNLSSILSF